MYPAMQQRQQQQQPEGEAEASLPPAAAAAATGGKPWEGGGAAGPALYSFRLSDWVGPEYVAAAEDVARTLVIQVVVQALVASSDEGTPFFSGVFWLLILYISIGTVAYHVLVRRFLRVV